MSSFSPSSTSKMESLKRQSDATSTVAYVHNLSPVKRNRSNTMDYVSMTLQTAPNTTVEALLYSPQKRPLFARCQESRTPLKLKHHTYTADKNKIVINDMTNVTTPHSSEYSFQYAEITQSGAKQDPTTILQILNSKKEWDNVVVTAKVTQLNEKIAAGRNKLNLSEAILADESGSMPIDIWEACIEKAVSLGALFTFRPLQVRVWSGKKKLSTIKQTSITPVKDLKLEPIPLVETDCSADVETVAVKEFLSIQHFNKFPKCPKCKKSIQHSTSKIIKCNRCGVMRADKCSYGMTIKELHYIL